MYANDPKTNKIGCAVFAGLFGAAYVAFIVYSLIYHPASTHNSTKQDPRQVVSTRFTGKIEGKIVHYEVAQAREGMLAVLFEFENGEVVKLRHDANNPLSFDVDTEGTLFYDGHTFTGWIPRQPR